MIAARPRLWGRREPPREPMEHLSVRHSVASYQCVCVPIIWECTTWETRGASGAKSWSKRLCVSWRVEVRTRRMLTSTRDLFAELAHGVRGWSEAPHLSKSRDYGCVSEPRLDKNRHLWEQQGCAWAQCGNKTSEWTGAYQQTPA
jgi:hypothetical protein